MKWGLVERGPQGLAATPRFRAALARAAAALQAEQEERTRGARTAAPASEHPLAAATARALTQLDVPATRLHRQFLFVLELQSLPEAVRALLGRDA